METKIETAKEQSRRLREEAGLYNSKEAAEWLNVPQVNFLSLVYREEIPKPARKMIGSTKRFYSLADLKEIEKQRQ